MEPLASISKSPDIVGHVSFVNHVHYGVLEHFCAVLVHLQTQVVTDLFRDLFLGVILVVKEVWVFFFDTHDHRRSVGSSVQLASARKTFSVLECRVLLKLLYLRMACQLGLVDCEVFVLRLPWSFAEVGH
jgi:hypothetical protein